MDQTNRSESDKPKTGPGTNTPDETGSYGETPLSKGERSGAVTGTPHPASQPLGGMPDPNPNP